MWRKRPVSDDQSERVIGDVERARKRTMDRAVRLLAAKPRSVTELRDRLLEKSWTNTEIVAEVIERLREYKYLDDEQYARDTAASKLRQRPQGRRRLEHDMAAKKLDKQVVRDAIDSAFEQMPEADLIKIAIEKRVRLKGVPKTREELKKFYDHLLRRGFGYDIIRENMPTAAGEDDE